MLVPIGDKPSSIADRQVFEMFFHFFSVIPGNVQGRQKSSGSEENKMFLVSFNCMLVLEPYLLVLILILGCIQL